MTSALLWLETTATNDKFIRDSIPISFCTPRPYDFDVYLSHNMPERTKTTHGDWVFRFSIIPAVGGRLYKIQICPNSSRHLPHSLAVLYQSSTNYNFNFFGTFNLVSLRHLAYVHKHSTACSLSSVTDYIKISRKRTRYIKVTLLLVCSLSCLLTHRAHTRNSQII